MHDVPARQASCYVQPTQSPAYASNFDLLLWSTQPLRWHSRRTAVTACLLQRPSGDHAGRPQVSETWTPSGSAQPQSPASCRPQHGTTEGQRRCKDTRTIDMTVLQAPSLLCHGQWPAHRTVVLTGSPQHQHVYCFISHLLQHWLLAHSCLARRAPHSRGDYCLGEVATCQSRAGLHGPLRPTKLLPALVWRVRLFVDDGKKRTTTINQTARGSKCYASCLKYSVQSHCVLLSEASCADWTF